MSKKSYLYLLIIITAIFFSYNYLKPLGDGLHNIDKTSYTFKTHDINSDNKWSKFKSEGKGKFFIHPGEEKASRGIFTFKKDANLIFNFSIKKGSKYGDIEFIIKKNNKEIDKSIVTINKKNSIEISVKSADKIEVIADKHGRTSSDGGNLQIKVQEADLDMKKFIIPFLCSILFIFLFGKKHTYIAINSYIIFILMLFAEKLNFGALAFNNILTYMLLLFSMTFIFTFVYQELTKLKKFRIASILSYVSALIIYIIPLFFIIYALNFDTKVTKDILYAIFQSNSDESYEYISDFISIKYILLFIFISSLVGVLLYKQEKKETLKIEKSLLIFIITTFLSISIVQFSQLRLPNFVIEGFDTYSQELKLFREVQEKRKSGEIKFSATKKEQSETYIIIIGESLNKKHMGIYGYFRDTTPFLSKINNDGELIVFNNVYSSHTHTVAVLKLALTEINQYNNKKYNNSLSIIEILNKADIETYWLTNQTIYGAWDNMVSVIASSANNLIALNTAIGKHLSSTKHDGALIDEVKKVLSQKTDKNRVIFVHLLGNHGSYTSRFPKNKYTIYKGKLKLGEFGKEASKNNNINNYDNSVVYNDYVVSSILKELKKEKGVNGFVYMSDHTDDVIGKVGHNSSKFTYEMTQIPMIFWFSEEYKKEYSSKYNNLLNNANKLYSNDMLYDTLIGIFSVKTDEYNSTYDFTSSNYNLNPKDALVLYGDIYNPYDTGVANSKKYYTDKSNYIYWQKENAKYLIDTNQSSRIFPHRVNSVGKLKDIWNDGFRSFEVDVRFGDNNSTVFQVGHNHGKMGIGLEEFLSRVNYNDIERVWLDFKNLDENNYKKALARLQYLDKKFDIKNKFIVESGTTAEFFNEFKKEGWHTSYYMPTGTIIKLLKDKNNEEMEKFAAKLAKQAELQDLSATSFDNSLYPFVKKYLEHKITNKIVYHIWYAPSLNSINFKDVLFKNKLYLDNRVKTLLTRYKSQFDL